MLRYTTMYRLEFGLVSLADLRTRLHPRESCERVSHVWFIVLKSDNRLTDGQIDG